MDNKMTSGEIAKKAGISQKAVRLYDEKGLLKPIDYSEGNYRLYDNESLLVLEKIIALKQVGFSLEEIRDNLVGNTNTDILSTLKEQINLMEAKRYELERAITRIKAVIARSNGQPDWDDVADILKSMQEDQNRDDGHFFALDHTKDELDWYVKIFRSLNVKSGERVLDLGCGYAKVWRNNWEDIPDGVKIDGYDLRGSWADDFEKFISENEGALSTDSEVKLFFENIEEQDTWRHIGNEGKYSMIIAHYLTDELKDAEGLISKAASVLSKGGVMSLNVFGTIPEVRLKFWIELFEELKLDATVFKKQLATCYEKKAKCREVLEKNFSLVDTVIVPCNFSYDKVEDLCIDLEKCIPDYKNLYEKNATEIKKRLEKKLLGGTIKVPHNEEFWRLSV